MKEKGFTLIELLGTIALVAIIATSAVVAVNSLINKQKEKLATVAEEHIKEASLTYFSNKKTYILNLV
jgi:prepilin-type N-terminal cleavage/methylation domain-containing protein